MKSFINFFLFTLIFAASSAIIYFCLHVDSAHIVFLERTTIENKMVTGCVLVAPYHEYRTDESTAQMIPRVFLVNKRTKKVAKSWSTDFPVTTAKIDQNGKLWILTNVLWAFLSPVEIKSLDHNSQAEHVIKMPNIRLDFDFTENGILFAQFDLLPHERSGENKKFKYDRVVEVNPSNQKIIWEFDIKTMLPHLFNEVSAHQSSSLDMTHVNSVRYIKKNPITQTPAVLVIVRNISRVLLIEKETKKVLWMSSDHPKYPHDARMLENGELTLFNNRGHAVHSSVEQWNLLTNQLTWKYESLIDSEFQSSVFGSAQRLKNGNTLITEGVRGHVIEVTPQGEVVWEYYQTFDFNDRRSSWPIAPLFRVDQYSPEFIEKLGWGNICS